MVFEPKEADIRIYHASLSEKNIFLDEKNRHHLMHVMRAQLGDVCNLFNGVGQEVSAKIIRVTKHEVVLEVLHAIERQNESAVPIHLFQALCKGEKMDWILQKTVELGVMAITPIVTERCEVKLSAERLTKKQEHWRKIIVSAAAQSERAVVPVLHAMATLPTALQKVDPKGALLFSPSAACSWRTFVPPQNMDLAIFIGPEGGFSPAEMGYAQQLSIACVTFGKRILRTETAATAIITALHVLHGEV